MDIIMWQVYAAKARITLEQRYRLKIVQLEEQGLSNASAESRAKTESEWALYKKIELLYSLGEECVRMAKISIGNSY